MFYWIQLQKKNLCKFDHNIKVQWIKSLIKKHIDKKKIPLYLRNIFIKKKQHGTAPPILNIHELPFRTELIMCFKWLANISQSGQKNTTI